MQERRVLGDKLDLDYGNVSQFFEERGRQKELSNIYNYVLYQDDAPELAIKRDEQEKQRICAILGLEKGQTALDIGCGVGRWGETLLAKGLNYVGIDASRNMIDLATHNLAAFNDKRLLVGRFQEFTKVLRDARISRPFDKVFVNGVFMYLNDADFDQALLDIYSVCAERCEIYVKESMGVDQRLTLNDIYSESLTQNYSAIYRSIAEYRQALASVFGPDFALAAEGRLFDEELANREETVDYCMILRRER